MNWTSPIETMVGKIVLKVEQTDDTMLFFLYDKTGVKFYHQQGCCESVAIEDVNGDVNDLIGHPLLVAEERVSAGTDTDYESSTWTFYTFRSVGGSVDVRWFGVSNGYYSERVDSCRFFWNGDFQITGGE